MLFKQYLLAHSRQLLLGAAVVVLGAAYGCTYSQGEAIPAPGCDVPRETITYAGVISPIFDRHCRECHATVIAGTLGGGTDLGSYQSIRNYGDNALIGTIEHTAGYLAMPKNRPKVSDCDIARIKAWMAAGKPNN